MAFTWRTYSAYAAVSAGLAITGAGLFTYRAWMRGEQLAELSSAAVERRVWAYHSGTNFPAIPTNFISSHTLWGQLYAPVMDASRAMATNVSNVLWLLPSQTIADGGLLTETSGAWTSVVTTNTTTAGDPVPIIVRSWSLTSATSHTDRAACTASLKPYPGFLVWPGVSSNRAPLSSSIYGVTNAAAALSAPAPWWASIGNGSNSYAFSCEHLPKVSVTAEGAGFSNSPSFFPANVAGDSASVTVFSADHPSNTFYRSARYTVSRAGLQDSYFAVTDNGSSSSNKLNIFYPQYTVAEGSTGYVLPFEARRAPAVPTRVTVTRLYGTRIDVRLRFTYEGYDMISSNNLAKQLYVNSPDDSDAIDDVVVYRIAYDGQYNDLTLIQNDAQTDPDIILSPVSASDLAKGTGSATFSATLARDGLNTATVSRHTLSNNLIQSANILTNLTRTIWIGSLSDLTASNFITYAGSAYTNTGSIGPEGSRLADSLPALWTSTISGLTNQTATTNATLVNPIADIHLTGDREEDCWNYSGSQAWYASATVDADYETKVAEGCRLPYPPREAILSNLVSRITVYACASVSRIPAPLVYANQLWRDTNSAYSISGTLLTPSAWSSEDYGTGLSPAEHPAFPVTPSISSTGYDTFSASTGSAAVLSRRLSLLADVTSPADSPSFSLGVREPLIADDIYHAVSSEAHYADIDYLYALASRRGGSALSVDAFIVVVDWNWRHANPSMPFQPQTWTPEWVSTNTP